MTKYEFEEKTFCIVYSDKDWKKGLNFITSEDYYIQAGSWWYDKGKVLDSHTHNEFERKANGVEKLFAFAKKNCHWLFRRT